MLYIKNMKEILQNKKIRIGILVLCILILVGIILGIALKGDGNQTGKEDGRQDIIVHEADKDTVEEKAEGGLTESDSEDGPVLNEDNMIDFNGSDTETDDKKTDSESDGNEATDNESANNNAGNESGDNNGNDSEDNNADDSTDENPKEDDEEDSEDTGSWGTFY